MYDNSVSLYPSSDNPTYLGPERKQSSSPLSLCALERTPLRADRGRFRLKPARLLHSNQLSDCHHTSILSKPVGKKMCLRKLCLLFFYEI